MNIRTALTSLVVALVVAVAAWLVLRPPPVVPPVPKTWLRTLDPLLVQAISVKWTDGQSATIEQSAVPGLWVLQPGPATKGRTEAAPWPVSINQVRGMLRLFADLDSVPPTDGTPPASGTTVTIRFQDGTEHELTLVEASLGGKTLVVVHGPPDTVRVGDGGLEKMFQSGLLAWRQPLAMCGNSGDVPGEASRIHLQTIGRQVRLGQTLGRWGVLEPVAAPADQGVCAQLLHRLGALPVQAFVEDQSDSLTGLGSPSAMIDTESDFRTTIGGQVVRRVLRQKVTVGGAADTGGSKLFATIRADWDEPGTSKTQTVWGPTLVTLARSDLDALTADVTAYLSKQSVEKPAADLSGVALTMEDGEMPAGASKTSGASQPSVHIVRTLDGWRYKSGNGPLRTPSPSDDAQINALIHLLCEQPADSLGLEPPSGAAAIALVDVQAGAGLAQQVRAGVAQVTPAGKPAQPALILRSGPVFRVYLGKAALDVARWIKEELPPEG